MNKEYNSQSPTPKRRQISHEDYGYQETPRKKHLSFVKDANHVPNGPNLEIKSIDNQLRM